ncbi:hypothetical protein ACWD3D_34780, partial [Streptomyces sp. NPDC002690]
MPDRVREVPWGPGTFPVRRRGAARTERRAARRHALMSAASALVAAVAAAAVLTTGAGGGDRATAGARPRTRWGRADSHHRPCRSTVR